MQSIGFNEYSPAKPVSGQAIITVIREMSMVSELSKFRHSNTLLDRLYKAYFSLLSVYKFIS